MAGAVRSPFPVFPGLWPCVGTARGPSRGCQPSFQGPLWCCSQPPTLAGPRFWRWSPCTPCWGPSILQSLDMGALSCPPEGDQVPTRLQLSSGKESPSATRGQRRTQGQRRGRWWEASVGLHLGRRGLVRARRAPRRSPVIFSAVGAVSTFESVSFSLGSAEHALCISTVGCLHSIASTKRVSLALPASALDLSREVLWTQKAVPFVVRP